MLFICFTSFHNGHAYLQVRSGSGAPVRVKREVMFPQFCFSVTCFLPFLNLRNCLLPYKRQSLTKLPQG